MQGVKIGKVFLDIGGTLSKLCYITNQNDALLPHNKNLTIKLPLKSLYFTYFKRVQQCWEYINKYFNNGSTHQIEHTQKAENHTKQYSNNNLLTLICITGGGAYKYQKQLKQICQGKKAEFKIIQEFQSLVAGLRLFQKYSEYQQFVGSNVSKDTHEIQQLKVAYKDMKRPLLVVNVGSGVSILTIKQKQNGQLSAERIGGTSLGGGFFMGMANLLTGQNNFQTLLKMAQQGDVKNTDIIPSDFPELSQQFSEATVLVSLGKLDANSSKQDIVKSLFYMMSLSYSQISEINDVLFTGFYCRDNQFVLKCFAQAFNFFTKKKKAKNIYSMQHDGFLGVLGAFKIEQND